MQKYFLSLLVAAVFLLSGLTAYAGKNHHSTIPASNLSAVGATLAKQYTYEPVNPPLPNHLWMNVGGGQIRFLHFNKAASEEGAKLIFIGDGIKGRFCAEDQPEGGKTGFVHFHSAHKMKGAKHGHGGKSGTEGYWLRHIAVAGFEMKGTQFTPGIAHNFKQTNPPSCG